MGGDLREPITGAPAPPGPEQGPGGAPAGTQTLASSTWSPQARAVQQTVLAWGGSDGRPALSQTPPGRSAGWPHWSSLQVYGKVRFPNKS